MRKLLLSSFAVCISLAVFAQGKVRFETDSLHLAYWPYGPVAGTAINDTGGLPALAADLYLGTSSSLLYLYSSTTFGTVATSGAGKWNSVNVLTSANATTGAPLLNGGTSVFVEVQVRSTERAAPNIFDPTQAPLFSVCFFSAEFNFTLGSGLTYPVLWGANGNWPNGTYPMDQYGVGSRGAIPYVPEPSAIALLGLGAAALVAFRRQSFSNGVTRFNSKV